MSGFMFGFVAIPFILGLIIAYILITRKKYIFALSLVLSFLFLFSSLFIPVTVYKHEELSNLRLGLPLKFVLQDQSRYDPPMPWQVRLYSAAENPTQILWPQFVISLITVFVLIAIILNILKFVYNSRQRKT